MWWAPAMDDGCLVECELCGELVDESFQLTKTYDTMVDGPGLMETETRVCCRECYESQ